MRGVETLPLEIDYDPIAEVFGGFTTAKELGAFIRKRSFGVAGRVHLPVTMDSDDLEQEGWLGALKAREKFDASLGVKFETFAAKRISGEMLDKVRNSYLLGRQAYENISAVERQTAAYREITGEEPSESKLAELTGLVPEQVTNAIKNSLFTEAIFSLDEPLRGRNGTIEDEANTLGEATPGEIGDPEEEAVKTDMIERMLQAAGHLPERERVIIGLYYVEGMSFQQIADVFHVTKPRICQIHNRSLLRLRRMMEVEFPLEQESYEPVRRAIRRYDEYPIAEPDFPRIGPAVQDKTA